MRSRTYAGRAVDPVGGPPAGARTMPNLVASTTSSRRPAIASPMISSLSP